MENDFVQMVTKYDIKYNGGDGFWLLPKGSIVKVKKESKTLKEIEFPRGLYYAYEGAPPEMQYGWYLDSLVVEADSLEPFITVTGE